MIIYNSKIEEMRHKIFENNPEFNLLGIFDIYDENQDGSIDKEEFKRFIEELGVKEEVIEIDIL